MTISYWDEWCTGAVNLVDYCNIVGFWECAFFGVNNAADVESGCGGILDYRQRKLIARYLCEAQEEIEEELNYPIIPSWFTEEEHNYRIPIITRWAKVISGGIRAADELPGNPQALTNADPAIITINDPAVAEIDSIDEVKVYYPDTTFELIPSAIDITGDILTISIPRCRAVDLTLIDTPVIGLDYTVDGNFETQVDVWRVYNDPSTQAELVDPHNCSLGCSSGNCSEYTHTACIYVKKARLGVVDIMPATYADEAWTKASCARRYHIARLNYYAGLIPITKKLQDSVIRLAHSKMSKMPCACNPIKALWERDMVVPEVLSPEQLLCPFGSSDGAWWAWKQVQSVKLRKMGIL